MKIELKVGPKVVLTGPNDEDTELLMHFIATSIREWALRRGYFISSEMVDFHEDGDLPEDVLLGSWLDCDRPMVLISLPSLIDRGIHFEEEGYEN